MARCDCGNTCVVVGKDLRSGHSKSCGCLHGQNHGMSKTQIHRIWSNIKTRCLNPANSAYKHYGGRNITMFPDWINNFSAFYNFVSRLEHFDEPNYSIDRINVNGNYEPGNLRWATAKEQARNQRRNIIVEYNGETMTLAEATDKSGIPYNTLKQRNYAGDRGDYLFRPVRHRQDTHRS